MNWSAVIFFAFVSAIAHYKYPMRNIKEIKPYAGRQQNRYKQPPQQHVRSIQSRQVPSPTRPRYSRSSPTPSAEYNARLAVPIQPTPATPAPIITTSEESFDVTETQWITITDSNNVVTETIFNTVTMIKLNPEDDEDYYV